MHDLTVIAIVVVASLAYEFGGRKSRGAHRLAGVLLCAAAGGGLLVAFLYLANLWLLLPAGALLGYAVGAGSSMFWRCLERRPRGSPPLSR